MLTPSGLTTKVSLCLTARYDKMNNRVDINDITIKEYSVSKYSQNKGNWLQRKKTRNRVQPSGQTPGEISPGEISPGEISPGDISPGEISLGEISPGEKTANSRSPNDRKRHKSRSRKGDIEKNIYFDIYEMEEDSVEEDIISDVIFPFFFKGSEYRKWEISSDMPELNLDNIKKKYYPHPVVNDDPHIDSMNEQAANEINEKAAKEGLC